MNLLVFLSDRCNMACDYCFLALNSKPATVLSEADGARAVDSHLSRFGARARFTLLGGEPLLHPELALSLARRARAKGAKVTLVSNGTKAEPAVVKGLLGLGVEVAVSLDGKAESHDAHRRALGGGKTHAAVMTALAKLDPAVLRVNLVISEDTVGAFLSNVEWLRAGGFTRLSFHADVARPWTPTGLKSLEAALAGFARYARALDAAAPGSLSLWHLDSYRASATAAPSEDDELVLGADGRYYAGDAWLSKPYGQGLDGAVGDLDSGVDEAKRRALLAEADRGVAAALAGERWYTWPRETFLLARLSGRDPAAAARAFRAADAVLGDALSKLAREHARA
ncbi:MAG: radical SAM protein [Elusimicrobia bacterium]|nr:radical SAM protein [Elusimicrobiota bacterium]